MKSSILFILCFVITANAFSQETVGQRLINRFRSDVSMENAAMSIYALDLQSGEVLLESKPQLCIAPASVLKLLTTATALELLGNDYRFTTTVWIEGKISGRTLKGNLVVSGGGDPTLGSSYINSGGGNSDFLSSWARMAKAAGIDTITGSIVADPFIYADQDVPQTWIWEDMGNYYGAAARGIALYDNTLRIVFDTGEHDGGKTQIVATEPFMPGLTITNEVSASNDTRDRAYVYGSTFDSYRVVKGTLPKGRKNYTIRASIPDPALLLAHDFHKTLTATGIVIEGGFKAEKVNDISKVDSSAVVVQWVSAQLSDIIKPLNYESINLFAEHLCKHIGLVANGDGSTQSGLQAIVSFWNTKGIDTRNLFLADGSGLSRANAITAKTLTEVLHYMYQHSKHTEVFVQSIPLTGIGGTQQYYFRNSFLKGKAHAKSGSMTRVRSFAGYMYTQNGRSIAYTIMVNNFNGSGMSAAFQIEKLMEEIFSNF
jgi:serine-type D-Ala-D-Ala carboxypeptidase/endopeptidase (penicillin-binding protein 4)